MQAEATGFVTCGDAANYLQKIFPGFKIKHYGFSKFATFLAAYPDLYELRRTGQGLCYRSLANDGATDSPLTTEAEHSQKQEPPQGEEMTQDDAQPPGTEDTQAPRPRGPRTP